MSNTPMTTQIFTMWENGRSLKNSPWAFSPKVEKEEYDRLHKLSAIQIFKQASEDAVGKGISGLDAFNASTSAVTPLMSARSDWATRAQGFIIHHLLQENLYGVGFEPPRTMSSQPFEIPSACWKGQIRWNKDELISDGLRFVHIRVRQARLNDQDQWTYDEVPDLRIIDECLWTRVKRRQNGIRKQVTAAPSGESFAGHALASVRRHKYRRR